MPRPTVLPIISSEALGDEARAWKSRRCLRPPLARTAACARRTESAFPRPGPAPRCSRWRPPGTMLPGLSALPAATAPASRQTRRRHGCTDSSTSTRNSYCRYTGSTVPVEAYKSLSELVPGTYVPLGSRVPVHVQHQDSNEGVPENATVASPSGELSWSARARVRNSTLLVSRERDLLLYASTAVPVLVLPRTGRYR